MANRLLLVEDDRRLIRALTDLLGNQGCLIEVATDGTAGLELGKTQVFDLIILDVMLPSKNGIEICRGLREAGVDTPILMLTARNHVTHKVEGFNAGADDYLAKPFDVDELRVRIEALIRRASGKTISRLTEYRFGNVHVNFKQGTITRPDGTLEVSERESRLLRYFIQNRGKLVTREMLLSGVWGYNPTLYTRTVDVHILRLRQKIENDPKDPQFLITVHGMGYRFDG